jgi:hypothetical protein
MSALRRYAFDDAPLDSYQVRHVAVRHIYRRAVDLTSAKYTVAGSPEALVIALRGIFGYYASRRAARLLGVDRSSLSRYARGLLPIPPHIWRRLHDAWSELERYRKAEIAARQREFDAIIEQEHALIVFARKIIDLQNLDDPLAKPDSPLHSVRTRHYRRRQEMRLREPAAALALSILFPSAGAER